MSDIKKTILSGMQPTGYPSLGNYLGAHRNWVKLQHEYNCLFFVADLHSLTVRNVPAELRKKTRDLFILYIALGLDPQQNIIFCQSHVPAHVELSWILNCYTYMGELSRMTQFKDKSQQHAENINAGLFTYPVLMAADVLLYQADLVPIGDDQKQHLEICRDIAMRFNNIYGDTFKIPEGYYGEIGARVKSLQEPDKKMSKSESENLNNVVFLLDSRDVIISKFKKAVTDSENEIRHAESKPGISNLLEIYAASTGTTIAAAEQLFAGKGYGTFKAAVGEAVADLLKPVQDKFYELSKDKAYIDGVMSENAARAAALADRTLRKVKKRVGL